MCALGSAAAGVAVGFAAAGGTTAAVMALGTASTGTAIASLSGVAATNATLAALGGGGIALGTTILGASTLGVGLLVGGIIFSVVGNGTTKKPMKHTVRLRRIKPRSTKYAIICASSPQRQIRSTLPLNSSTRYIQDTCRSLKFW